MRRVTLVAIVTMLGALAACNDLRDFRGTWQGSRVGDAPALRVGPGATATLSIDDLDSHGIHARIAIENLVTEAQLSPIPGAEADALANLTFSGGPLRVYLGFVALTDGRGDALAVIALYDDQRVELRVLRNGTNPVYAIFALKST